MFSCWITTLWDESLGLPWDRNPINHYTLTILWEAQHTKGFQYWPWWKWLKTDQER